MGIFSKRGDYIDYSLLQKRGLLKPQPKKENDFLDLTRQQADRVFTEANSNLPSNASSSNPLASFFDSAQNNSPNMPTSQGITAYGNDSSDVNSLKLKIEDLEFKIERLIERLNGLELGKN
ncbi:MAG: hypothetical protein AABW80_00840 [Nanoarchaeota archaeon]